MSNELKKEEKKKMNPILWFLFAIVIPVIIAISITVIAFAIAGVNVLDWAKEKGNNLPVVNTFITTEEEAEAEQNEEKVQSMIAEKDSEIEGLMSEVATLEGVIDQLEQEILKLENTLEQNSLEQEDEQMLEEDLDTVHEMANSFKEMNSKRAARLVEQLEQNIAVSIFKELASEDRGAILAEMDPEIAAEITELFMQDSN
ncbi:hypothetical protein GMD78_16200 [Ornithinibacillus sp. L9]|uniref:Magnesium transporter MgtE intracellular domain-containing protein n=1 Tax=Ornithinibacillus caprae TaxID=2678566 RepID=A0A6N8FKL2_9BACI|nr:hypothetical protein [Ornithinibacillus caprae]MUK89913.1 hypothetical protein [Ornithinibacillus caprae]